MKTSVLTNKGVSVVRAAQSKFKKVTVLDAVTSTHFENSANELATKSGTWFNGAVGQIKSVKSGGNHLKVQVTFPATPYAQPLKSVGIRILAEGDNRPYILYAESDGNSAVTLGSEFTCEYDLPINVGVQTIEPEGDYPEFDASAYYTKAEIDGGYLNQVAYNADTNTLNFASENGARTVSVSLD